MSTHLPTEPFVTDDDGRWSDSGDADPGEGLLGREGAEESGERGGWVAASGVGGGAVSVVKESRARFPRAAMVFIYSTAVLQSFTQSALQAILAVMMQEYLAYGDAIATVTVNLYMFVYNIVGPVGAVLADKWRTNYVVELYSAFVWTLGAVIMVFVSVPFVTEHELRIFSCFFGLFLSAVGYGVINATQSVLVGDQFVKGQEVELQASFGWLYMFFNVGNIMGEFGGPVMREYVSVFSVLAAVGGASVVGTVVFAAGSRSYRKVPPAPPERWTPESASACWSGFTEVCWKLRNIFRVFAPLPVFWALLYLQSSVWIFQGEQMNLQAGKVSVPPDIMPSLDDILCVVLVPLTEIVLYPAYRRCTGHPMRTLTKMTIGMVCITVAFVLSGLLQLYIDQQPRKSVSIAWQGIPYLFLSCGEIFVAVPGLEFAYSQAPKALKNSVTAAWGVTQALGSLIDATVFSIGYFNRAKAVALFLYAGVMLVFIFVFLASTRNFPYVRSATVDIEGEIEQVFTVEVIQGSAQHQGEEQPLLHT